MMTKNEIGDIWLIGNKWRVAVSFTFDEDGEDTYIEIDRIELVGVHEREDRIVDLPIKIRVEPDELPLDAQRQIDEIVGEFISYLKTDDEE